MPAEITSAPTTFPCTMEGLAAASDFLSEALAGVGCPPKVATKFMVAFDEMGSNVVRYSGAADFMVAASLAEGEVRVEISDSGVAYNPLEKDDPDVTLTADERAVGGLGIFMTKKLMDKLEYNRTSDGRNVVVLRRKTEG